MSLKERTSSRRLRNAWKDRQPNRAWKRSSSRSLRRDLEVCLDDDVLRGGWRVNRPPRLGGFGPDSLAIEFLDEGWGVVTHFYAKDSWLLEMFQMVGSETMPQGVARPISDPGPCPVAFQSDA